MGVCGIFVLLAIGAVCLRAAQAEYGCTQQFDSFRQCVRGQMARDQNDPTASETRRTQMKNDFNTCAQQNQCQSPFESDRDAQARQKCFNDARTAIRQQLQWCVQFNYGRDFQLPGDDNDKDAYWNYVLIRSLAAMSSIGDNRYNRNRNNKQSWQRASGSQQPNEICGNNDDRKNKTAICVRDKGVFNKTSAKSNWRKNSCRIKRQCNQISQQCQQQWDLDIKPRICDCVNTLKNNNTLNTIQNNYIGCLWRSGLQNVDQNNDDGRQVVAKMLAGWCASGKLNRTQINQTDPCNQANRRRGNNGNTNNNGNSNNGNNGNTQPTDTGYDDGSPAETANVDPLSGVLGGSTDVLSGNPLGQLLGGGPSLIPGGSSGGSPFGSITQSLGAGGLTQNVGGGLFGGGSNPIASLLGNGGGGGAGNILSSITGGGSSPASSLLGTDTSVQAASSMGAFGPGGLISGDAGNLLGGVGGLGIF